MLDPAAPEGEDAPPSDHADEAVPVGVMADGRTQSGPNGSGRFSLLRLGVVAIVVAAALVAWFLTRGSSPAYRMATVGTGTVEATLDSVGTITPVNQANLNFSVSGTVSAVDVSVGQSVTAGQTLATLDLTSLNATVVSAKATLATAQATLASAETSETSTSSSSTSTGSAHAATSTTVPSGGSSSATGNSQQVAQLQTTLTADQSQEDADSSQLSASLQQASSLCESTTTTTTTTAPTSGGSGAPTTCAEALSQASAAQALVAADIKKVDQDESGLTAALEASSGGASSGTARVPSTSASTTADVTTAGDPTIVLTAATTPSGSAGTGGGQSSKPATPQQLAVDQASIDTAQASLDDAEQALAGADLVSTISGTVASVSLVDGDAVTAGSSTTPAQVVIVGAGSSYDLITDVPVADIGRVAVGQQADITPDSTNSVVTGHVSSVGVLATTGTSSTTYPVTISLNAAGLGQLSGADADVEIVTHKSVGVMTVPSSAVRTEGTIHLVTVLKNGTTPTPVRVTLGTVGDVLTQVTSGLTKGESVSLAALDDPLPSTSTATTRTGLGGLTGGRTFGGGDFGGGRFGG
ncbi:MAG TPA: biotin/lipoyl-binding protein [Acidimicrobiales bacterium]|nr:biotin/lipoyl-binding protein [Acidimicrobiales bacterium]